MVYYFYHHMDEEIRKDKNKIFKAFEEHDFKTFIKFYTKYNAKGLKYGGFDNSHEFSDGLIYYPIVYFPDDAMLDEEDEGYDTENEDNNCLNILDEVNFNKITFAEWECG